MGLMTFGTMAVDWEDRVDYDRLRRARLARIKGRLKESELGALLCFDMNNVRYITATHIGTWAMDKLTRFCLLAQDEPVNWDFGSAARHHELYCPWLGERSRAGISTLRGAFSPRSGQAEDVARKPHRARGAWVGEGATRRRRDRAARSVRAPAGRDRGRRRAAADAARPRRQDRGRDHAAVDGVRHGRRRQRRALPRHEARHAGERVRRPRRQGALRPRLGAR